MKRIVWIDVSKIIGIYFVILGHALNRDVVVEGMAHSFIYIFHMPLFFFLSGYLFSVKTSFMPFVRKNIHSLIVPYFFLNFLALALMIPVYLHGHRSIPNLIFRIFIGDGHAPAGPAWFLLCLFWVRLMAYFYVSLSRAWRILMLVGVIFLAYLFPLHLYWRIDSALMAFPFFVVAHFIMMHKVCIRKNLPKLNNQTLFIFFLLFLICTLLTTKLQGETSIYARNFGNYPLFYYLGAFIGIFMILSISKLFSCLNLFGHVIASGTIVVMALHGTFYIYLNFIVPFFHIDLFRPVILSLCVLLIMYFPILYLQKHLSGFIGK